MFQHDLATRMLWAAAEYPTPSIATVRSWYVIVPALLVLSLVVGLITQL